MRVWVSVIAGLIASFQIQAQCLSGNCRDGYGKKKFKSGAIYTGTFQKNQISGKGKLQYSNGSVYVGEWKENFRHGKGKMKFKNGDLYQGSFKKSNMHGQGYMEFVNGDRYDGNFNNNSKHGYGIYAYHNGDIYSGNFKSDRRHGKGKMKYNDGSWYDGDWENDSKNGYGTYTDVNGYEYVGNWNKGEFMDASGSNTTTVEESSSSSTLDDFDLPSSSSSSESSSSSSDSSSSSHDSSSTTSSSPIKDESSLPNCNRENCHNVKGVYTYADGSKYIGDHQNYKPHGQGTMYYKSGDKYTGGWAKHAPHGKGFMTYRDGRTIGALWNYGSMIEIIEDDEGIVDEHIEVEHSKEVKVWAVIVGIGRYAHMQTLKYTDDDAYRMYAFLKSPEGGALPDEQISVLIDEDATRANMLRTMKRVYGKADENDVVMLYFSGHGLQGSFVPSDFDGLKNLVKHSEVTDIFKQSKAKHKIVFADACHSGSMLAMRSTSGVQATIDKYYGAFTSIRGGTALMLSSKSEETSLEDSGLRQGVFSHFLMRGLKGEADKNSNKVVTITELFDFVHSNVVSYTVRAQTPELTGNYDKNMPVAIMR